MTADDIKIISLALNNMKLDEMLKVDKSGGSSDIQTLRDTGETSQYSIGLDSPYILINGHPVSNGLTSFHLDINGFLPIVTFSFDVLQPLFISVSYPKDGDIVSVYMRSPGDLYNPMRMDYKILAVDGGVSSKYSSNGSDPDGKYFKFSIVAECYIPGLYSPKIKSFTNKSSADVLLEVSQELNLGFATNENNTVDDMTWICPSNSYYDFIQDVCVRAYKDDEISFFDCWVDQYYNLNFVNLGTQFSFQDDPKQDVMFLPGYTSNGTKVDGNIPGAASPAPVSVPFVLTNSIGQGITPFFINGYTLTSRSGNISNDVGYITEICFYDENSETEDPKDPSAKYTKYEIESQTPDNIETGTILQKGRARDNEYKNETRREWLGVINTKIDSTDGGVHKNYYHTKAQNIINNSDVNKITLEIEMNTYFAGVIRGQVVPVSIYAFDGGQRQQNTGNLPNKELNTTLSPTLDVFLSGNYVVLGVEIYWSKTGGLRQKLNLSKRAWTANSSGALPKAFPISIQSRQF
jgi:hypothetical protein